MDESNHASDEKYKGLCQALGLYLISAVCSGTLIRRVSACRTTARCLSRGHALMRPTTPASITAKLSWWGVCTRRSAIRPKPGSVRYALESPSRRGKPATRRPVQSGRRGPKSSASRASCWMRMSEMLSLHFNYRNNLKLDLDFCQIASRVWSIKSHTVFALKPKYQSCTDPEPEVTISRYICEDINLFTRRSTLNYS